MSTLRKLFHLSRGEWPLLLWGLLFLALSSAALLAYPQWIKRIIDEAISNRDQSALNRAAIWALAIFIIQAVTSSARYYFFTLAGEKTVQRLRANLFGKILSRPMSFFDAQKTGELIGRLSSDTAVLQNALSVNISMLVRAGAQVIGGVVMLFVTSPKLTGFILLLIPPMAWLAARFGKRVKTISRSGQDALATSSGVAEEGLSGIRTVKAFAQEGFEVKRYEERLKATYSLAQKKISIVASFMTTLMLLGLGAIVAVVWWGGTMVISGELTVGTLTSFLLYVITVAFSVGMLGSLWTDFMSAFGASARIFEILEMDQGMPEGIRPAPQSGRVEFQSVHFAYPSRPDLAVLRGVSFSIAPHESVAIVGSSGAGKSTVVQLLMRFYDPLSGEVLIDGQSLKDYQLKALRSAIGLVAQEPVLVSESIFDNIRYARPEASHEEVERAAKLAFAHDFIMGFPEGYRTLVGEKGVQLSGGQKQRVAIARALLNRPQLLILDEATSALDAESEHLVQKALEGLQGMCATLIIAHRLSTVKRADKILVMENGQVIQAGTHAELMKRSDGAYRKLVERQFESTGEVQ